MPLSAKQLQAGSIPVLSSKIRGYVLSYYDANKEATVYKGFWFLGAFDIAELKESIPPNCYGLSFHRVY